MFLQDADGKLFKEKLMAVFLISVTSGNFYNCLVRFNKRFGFGAHNNIADKQTALT